ncbi:FAD/NAD(P)-binding protein [Zavarzinia aquatilis]|uniref:FAD-dependent urate hydroxylase HpyO/Asp monooxygenase CreE-like FAD/NAD(P)-binding domain-containing protein n=1 Tax=Zavarzinia aquatilis TaxID=2211142 RepID=A0A317E049_9PROT|nr:FAD/NAD(P)-binding protein [Zavarzinia aquatilis]PWR19480.1 hypothetical protein DKG74_16960 [Zavarzinia aquatilis]
MRRVVVIGGGFTGTALAIHLARDPAFVGTVTVVEPGASLGAGIAYGLAGPDHRINVPADRMSVFRETPADFGRWMAATGRDESDPEGWTADRDHYSRRLDFGAYMADLFAREAARRPFAHRRGRAVGLTPATRGWTISLEDGTCLAADVVVLTASHAAPAFRWPLSGEAAAHPGLIRDPWSTASLSDVAPDAGVFIVGTGLTMADTVVSLRRRGHRGPITAVSRRALLPRGHGVFGADVRFPEPFPTTATGTLRALRRLIATCEGQGIGWHPAIDAFRGALRRLWPGLPAEEQDRALRHLRAWWDVHRYRIAPQVAALLAEGRRDGWLRVAAGRIEGFDARQGKLIARWQPRGGARTETPVAALVNCTGPDADPGRSADPLFQGLLATGIARPDRHRLGLDIGADGHVLDRSGRPQPGFFIAGPLGRGRLGEVMGVPEASDHAREIAARIATDLAIPSHACELKT